MYLSLISKQTAGNNEVLALTSFKILKRGEQGEMGWIGYWIKFASCRNITGFKSNQWGLEKMACK